MIDIKNLVKEYNGVRAVDNLCLNIDKGEIYGLLGPNGAGKSTTILMLTGLIQPTSGECLIDGTEVSKNPIEVKKKIGYMPEDVGFYSNLDAYENLHFFGRLYSIPEKELKDKIEGLLKQVGLNGVKKPVGGYSKGMRQRLGIAKAQLNDPSVIILDEPTANLDPKGVADYRKIIRNVAKEERTVLVSSHILSEISKVSTKIGILQKGRLVREGTWEELSSGQESLKLSEIRINIETTTPMPEISHSEIISAEYKYDHRFASIVAKSDIRSDIAGILTKNSIVLKNLALDSTTLEDAVLSYYNENSGGTQA
ncbi:ABC-2 type transport system ATP-binding protein [Methanomicrobium sp. W14]|uniref:ABC transporter ATP-binding protein n=1 Tax=Methanomicrobium sp. W14 TaxID=2817839 RepID=UPI001AE4A534|nr:ABC transporter ATP-binding protein [Methanomicrobium sp. W14]MBP2134141.1 ABC-2 type transport system ATP-binding protein [Methanomicrobium sp. W14]